MSHTKTLAAVITAALLAASLTACSASSSAPPATPASDGSSSGTLTEAQVVAKAPVASSIPSDSPTLAGIRKQGTLRNGASNNLKYFSLENPATGDYTGFDASMAKMLAKYILGSPKVTYVSTGSDTRESLIQNGTIDTAIETYSITPEREKQVNFAGPYFISGDTIMVRKADESKFTSVKDLNGKKVATEAGAGLQNLKKYAPGAEPVVFEDSSPMLQALQQDRVDAVLINGIIELGMAADNPGLAVTNVKVDTLAFGIGLPKNDPSMKTFVNDWLKKIEADGEWAALWKATVGQALPGNPPTPPQIGVVPAPGI